MGIPVLSWIAVCRHRPGVRADAIHRGRAAPSAPSAVQPDGVGLYRPSMSAEPNSSPSACPAWSAALAGYLWISRYVIASGRSRQTGSNSTSSPPASSGRRLDRRWPSARSAARVLGALFLGLVSNALPVRGPFPRSGRWRSPARAINPRGPRSMHAANAGRAASSSGKAEAAMSDVPGPTPSHSRSAGTGPFHAALLSWGSAARGGHHPPSSSSTVSPRPISSIRGRWSDLTFGFTEKALIALAMALLLISGEIDLSVAAIIALSSTLMGNGGRRPEPTRPCWW